MRKHKTTQNYGKFVENHILNDSINFDFACDCDACNNQKVEELTDFDKLINDLELIVKHVHPITKEDIVMVLNHYKK